jgi:hypothetical protein
MDSTPWANRARFPALTARKVIFGTVLSQNVRDFREITAQCVVDQRNPVLGRPILFAFPWAPQRQLGIRAILQEQSDHGNISAPD